jgi:hypothetical protein
MVRKGQRELVGIILPSTNGKSLRSERKDRGPNPWGRAAVSGATVLGKPECVDGLNVGG